MTGSSETGRGSTATPDAETQIRHLRLAAQRGAFEIDEFVLPADRHVCVGELRLHYLDWDAPASARDILFLHGAALTAHTWDLVCLGLRDAYRCLALDLRGHGDSDWAPDLDYSPDAHVGDIERCADELGLDAFVLVGMSLGGVASIEFAARFGDRLKGLVLVDVGRRVRMQGAARIRSFINQDAELDSIDAFVDRALRFNPKRDRELLRVSLLHNLRQLNDGRWTWKYDRRHHGRIDHAAIAERMRRLADRLPEISCPTLVVRGALSEAFLDEDAEEAVELLPDGRWTRIADAGHTVQGDNPRDLTAALRAFLSEIAA